MRKLRNDYRAIEEFLDSDGGILPHVGGPLASQHPHNPLYREATPIWHNGESPEDLNERMGDGYSCGFSAGVEVGIAMAIVKPEWAVGWYRCLRAYYLANNHSPKDLEDWPRRAEATARAIRIEIYGDNQENRQDG